MAAVTAKRGHDSSSSSSAAAASPSVALRHPDPPSLFSLVEPDALSIILAFALIDLPIERGQPYFPKELVRIVHEYASDDCFFVVEMSEADENEELRSSSDLLRWLGAHLPGALHVDDIEEEYSCPNDTDNPSLLEQNDTCLMEQHVRNAHGNDIARLLLAQLESNESRSCYLENSACTIDPDEWSGSNEHIALDKHDEFCLDALDKRIAAITARGEEPTAVGMRELLDRLRTTLQAGELPRGLSARPFDWPQLFSWIHTIDQQRQIRREANWKKKCKRENSRDSPEPIDPIPVLKAVRVRRQTQGVCFRTQCDAELWPKCTVQEPRQSMIVGADGAEEMEGDDEQSQQGQKGAQAAAANSSSSSAVASWSADSEAAARGAARQRCE